MDSCLQGQAVNFPTIRPQDNYAAMASTYEGIGGIERLQNDQNWERILPGELLPWEVNGEAGAYPPLVHSVVMPIMPVIPALELHPMPLSPPVQPLAVPFAQVPHQAKGDPRLGSWRANAVPPTPPVNPPVPGTPPAIEIPLVPGAVPRPVNEPHRLEPPRPGEVERKPRATFRGYQVVIRFVNFVSEVPDYVEALHSALPPGCKAKPVKLAAPERYTVPWMVRRRVADGKGLTRTHRAPTPQEKAQAIFDCWEHMDMGKAIMALVDNEIEDRAYGKLGQAAGKASNRLGLTLGIETGPAL